MNYDPDLVSTALKMLTALGIILGGLLAVFFYTRRKSKIEFGGSRERMVRVLGNSYIGVKKHISLVEVPGSILVLGITPESICLLTKIEDEEILDQLKISQEEKIWPSFSDQLYKISSTFKGNKNKK
jgi:flagellar biogenesis protein FliO